LRDPFKHEFQSANGTTRRTDSECFRIRPGRVESESVYEASRKIELTKHQRLMLKKLTSLYKLAEFPDRTALPQTEDKEKISSEVEEANLELSRRWFLPPLQSWGLVPNEKKQIIVDRKQRRVG
jgi:hypothetical protein